MMSTFLLFGLVSTAVSVSPVQKVVELLDECAGKVKADLAAEEAEMKAYSEFCDEELSAKGYNIETAAKSIGDLTASVEDSKATIADLESDIVATGSEIA